MYLQQLWQQFFTTVLCFLSKSTNHRISVPTSLSRRLQKLYPVVVTHSKPKKPLVTANNIRLDTAERKTRNGFFHHHHSRIQLPWLGSKVHAWNNFGVFDLEFCWTCLVKKRSFFVQIKLKSENCLIKFKYLVSKYYYGRVVHKKSKEYSEWNKYVQEK